VTRSTAAVAFAAGWLMSRRRRRRGRGARRVRATALRARPDPRRRPSDGVVAEASIVARLLRLQLLTLDATVVVSPAIVSSPTPRPAGRPPVRAPLNGSARTPLPAPAAPVGRRLTEAARTLDASAATLAAARRAAAAGRG